ncbi:MAG: hypothetical protein QNJ70_17575 [Xenococcaceae cyanobacterium MO_207.B15]|nr:hypothetical protein [Xenococcaceae cyanobacterium MO_207.B15]
MRSILNATSFRALPTAPPTMSGVVKIEITDPDNIILLFQPPYCPEVNQARKILERS